MARSSDHKISPRLRWRVLARDKFACHYCGRKRAHGVFLVMDHVVPICSGGATSMENLVSACHTCNAGKAGSHLPEDVLRRILSSIRGSSERVLVASGEGSSRWVAGGRAAESCGAGDEEGDEDGADEGARRERVAPSVAVSGHVGFQTQEPQYRAWLLARVDVAQDASETCAGVYEDYCRWVVRAGKAKPMSAVGFGKKLTRDTGTFSSTNNGIRYRYGMRLRAEVATPVAARARHVERDWTTAQ